MVKVLQIKGYKSLGALNAFSALLLGLKMLPQYLNIAYEEFYASFKDKSDEERESLLRQAAVFVKLEKDEVEALVSFATDANGIPYSPVNMGNLSLDQLHEVIVAVCMEIGRINVSLVSEAEKKKSLTSQSTLEKASLSDPMLH